MTFAADFTEFTNGINGFLSRIDDPIPFFDYVGEMEKHFVRERIMHTKIDPDGDYWIPWAPYTRSKREFQGNDAQGLLWDSGELLDSIKFEVDGAYGVDIGTDVLYAPKHQVGEGNVPARTFLGWEEDMLAHYASAFCTYLEGGRL